MRLGALPPLLNLISIFVSVAASRKVLHSGHSSNHLPRLPSHSCNKRKQTEPIITDSGMTIKRKRDDEAAAQAGTSDAGSPSAQFISNEAVKEEQRLALEREKADQKVAKAAQKTFSKKDDEEKLDKLNHLLEKSIVYSQFLADKIKKPDKADHLDGSGKVDPNKKEEFHLKQPELVSGGSMRNYQLIGVHWLIGLFENGLNGILGDEMGLGKTIQTIGFFAHLWQMGVKGPFMVVGPLSVLGNWIKEFQKWTPEIPAILYHGSKEERQHLRMTRMKKGPDGEFPCVVTSYEIVMRDLKELRRIHWKFLVVDEGHRLKNMNCRLIRDLKQLHTANRLLLSGTPLQNNLKELWSLLNFLLPDIFDDVETFERWFDFRIGDEEGESKIVGLEESNSIVSKLHLILKPFLLRRLKIDVELNLPPKNEYLLYVTLTEQQEQLYRALLTKNLNDTESGTNIRLLNVMMQLRKCCNHPYLFEWPEKGGNVIVDEAIVQCSGKMRLLDRIMTELKKEGGHQVLIFSQMTKLLDIIEEYMELRGYTYCRIDGGVPGEERLRQIDAFNEDPSIDCFLLSTRAGGLGLNLQSADTVIIYDSDWNPHADLQAMDRCHRIGQTKPVVVYRLSTADTVEEKVLEAAKNKLKLEQLVISKGKFKNVGKKTDKDDKLKSQELSNLLSYDPKKKALGTNSRTITDAELARVLDRTQRAEDSAEGGFIRMEKIKNAFDELDDDTKKAMSQVDD